MSDRRLWLPPLVGFLLVFGVLSITAMVFKGQSQHRYALPSDRSPRSLLAFMREMDGSNETSRLLVSTTNLDSVSRAVLEAHDQLKPKLSELSPKEQREATCLRLLYLSPLIAQGHTTMEGRAPGSLMEEVKRFLSASEKLGILEERIIQGTLFAFGQVRATTLQRDFADWVRGQPQLMSQLSQRSIDGIEKTLRQIALLNSVIDLKSRTVQGDSFDSLSLRGKVVLIEFWGTRCPPCIADFPALKRIHQQYQLRGFEVVGVCLEAEPARIVRSVQEHQLPWAQLCHESSSSSACNDWLADQYGVQAVPTTLLLDASGRCIRVGVRPLTGDENDLEKVLQQHLPDGGT
jgi:thiol-disulfide isomerase/thioredoxin